MKLTRPAVAFFTFGALAGMSSVALGAFAVHGLGKMVSDPERAVSLFKQATDFQMYHALSLILVALASERLDAGLARTTMRLSALLMCCSIVFFPGALYSAAFGGPQFFAPWGGFTSMTGWLLFGIGALLSLRSSSASDRAPSAIGLRQAHAAE